jgi:hypothetical protein
VPPKGWKRPKPLSADDYGMSLHHMQAILQNAEGLAKRHHDLPRMAVLLTIARDADKELSAAALQAVSHEQADQRHSPPLVPQPPDADRPGEA